MNIDRIRKDTLLHKDFAYLDSAAAAPFPIQVFEAMKNYLKKMTTHGPYLPSFRKQTYIEIDEIRVKAGAYIGASESEIAFVKNGTEAINFISNGIRWESGDEVILADLEFHSNFTPWLKLQNDGKIVLKVLKTGKSGVIDVHQLKKLISSRTRLITVSHLPNASGAIQPIKEICSLAKENKVLTLINASQTIGMVPINVQEIGCDFLAACGRKGLRGPEGSGILYIKEELIGSIEPVMVGWGGTTWDFDTNEIQYLPIAKRVEAGCLIVPSVLGLGAAIDYANEIGIQEIFTRVKHLTSYAVEQMTTIPGISIYGPVDLENRLSIIPFNLVGIEPARITQYLEENGIIIESGTFMANTMLQQYGINVMARVSLHYYNTEEEIDKTVELIKILSNME